jgi:hypothetical protein
MLPRIQTYRRAMISAPAWTQGTLRLPASSHESNCGAVVLDQ